MEELTLMSDSDALQMWYDLKLGYTESQGHPALREEIADLYRTLEPDDIVVMTPEEAIYITMNCITEPGDHVITTFPAYQSLYQIAESNGCRVSKWLPEAKEAWSFNIKQLIGLITDKTKLIVINFPHNPTGSILSEEALEELIRTCKERGIFLFSDEMYKYLEYDEYDITSSACDLYENAISLFGMSKSFALAGLRIGWLATKNKELINRFIKYKDYTTICNSAPSEILAIMGLRAKEAIIERNMGIIQSNLKLLDTFFDTYKDLLRWYRPQAGPIAFPELKVEMPVAEFCKKLIDEKGVMLLPSDLYDFDPNCFRIGFARKNMPEAMEKLEEFLKENF
jgi:aspartate/methionine/tyrosine aminotransferase